MTNSANNNQLAFDGHCAFAVSTGKTDVKGGDHTLTIDGKTYVFSNVIAKMLFRLLPGRLEKAIQVWTNR
jgi:hypothetical protein